MVFNVLSLTKKICFLLMRGTMKMKWINAVHYRCSELQLTLLMFLLQDSKILSILVHDPSHKSNVHKLSKHFGFTHRASATLTRFCKKREDDPQNRLMTGFRFYPETIFRVKMASAPVVETSVANNSPSRDFSHADDHFQSKYVTSNGELYRFWYGSTYPIDRNLLAG